MKPTIICIDLEGVLIPEIWIAFAKKTGIKQLELTTKDVEDYNELMKMRLEILYKNKLTLNHIKEVISTLNPLQGAASFISWVRQRTQIVILSDTFYDFAMPLMEKLNYPTLFCHSLKTDDNGFIKDYVLRTPDHKNKTVKAFKDLNFNTIAIGDSFNDISMLKQAHKGILFKAPDNVIKKYPDFEKLSDFDELIKHLENMLI